MVTSFATSIGVQLRAALAGREVALIAELAGLSLNATTWWSPVVAPADRIVSIAGEELSLGDWSVATRRHCPECLRADAEEAKARKLPADWLASHRSWWDVRSIAACPEHGVALIDACPSCSSPLGWRDAHRLVCPSCRGDLIIASSPLDDPLGRYVAARLGIGRSDRPTVLEDLPLRQAVRLCGKLGRAGCGGPPESSTAGVPSHALGIEGFRRAQMGVAALDDVLDRALARRSCSGPDGLGGAYGWLHDEWLGTDDPTAAPYKEALRRHAVAHGVIAEDEERLGAVTPPTINLTHAAAEAGVAFTRMRRALDDAGAIPAGSRRGVSFALDPDVVQLLGKPRGAVRRAAREVLGIGRTALIGLARAGHLDLADEEAFRASAGTLMAAVDRQLCAGRAPLGLTPITTATVSASVSMSRMIEAVLQGCIPAWRWEVGVGLAGVLVRAIDLPPLRSRPDGFTGVAAARSLRLHQECVRALIRDGTLNRDPDGLIAPTSINEFRATYVSGSELARVRGCSPASLVARLAEEGVRPAWPVATHRQALFRRSDLILPGGTVH
jgi:hypothetical protein